MAYWPNPLRSIGGVQTIYCVPLIDFGQAVLDFENHILAVGGRRIFLSVRKMDVLGLLLIAGGETVPLGVLIDILGLSAAKYPHHVIARIVREMKAQLASLPVRIAICKAEAGYRAFFLTAGPSVQESGSGNLADASADARRPLIRSTTHPNHENYAEPTWLGSTSPGALT